MEDKFFRVFSAIVTENTLKNLSTVITGCYFDPWEKQNNTKKICFTNAILVWLLLPDIPCGNLQVIQGMSGTIIQACNHSYEK